MGFVSDARSANSSFVETVWHTHSERAGTFTSAAVSNWEMVITTFNGKTMIVKVATIAVNRAAERAKKLEEERNKGLLGLGGDSKKE